MFESPNLVVVVIVLFILFVVSIDIIIYLSASLIFRAIFLIIFKLPVDHMASISRGRECSGNLLSLQHGGMRWRWGLLSMAGFRTNGDMRTAGGNNTRFSHARHGMKPK
jgi:hypothetical protein